MEKSYYDPSLCWLTALVIAAINIVGVTALTKQGIDSDLEECLLHTDYGKLSTWLFMTHCHAAATSLCILILKTIT